jgi:C4-dicarboxylate transporter, DcuC family
MSSLLIGLVITAIAARLIIKNYQPRTVLLVAGLILLGLTAIFYPEQSILYQNTKSVGFKGFDIFAFVKESLSTQIAGIGLIIMSAAAFADYMDHIGATGTMVRICIKPLEYVKAPYLILALGYVFGQLLHVAIPSAAGLAMLLLVTFFPMLISLRISKAAAAAMIGLTAFMDLGPAVGTANLAAKTTGMPAATYFVHHQIPVAIWVIAVVAVLVFITARHFDRGLPDGAFHKRAEPTTDESADATAPLFYALIPLVPIVLILVFSPLLVGHIAMDVVTAMILGAVVGMACELAVKRDVKVVFKGFQVFFNAIGAAFASIVSLLVCADVFAQGLQAIGAVGYMIDSVRGAGFGVNTMAVVMTLMVGATAMITGSGVAAFFAFSGLAPAIAAKFGVSAITMVLPMQLMAGMGRAISPVAGVIIAVSKAGGCSPFEIVRRTMIPALGGIIAMLVMNYLLNG